MYNHTILHTGIYVYTYIIYQNACQPLCLVLGIHVYIYTCIYMYSIYTLTYTPPFFSSSFPYLSPPLFHPPFSLPPSPLHAPPILSYSFNTSPFFLHHHSLHFHIFLSHCLHACILYCKLRKKKLLNNEFNVLEKSLKFMGVNVVFLPEVVCVERGSCVV